MNNVNYNPEKLAEFKEMDNRKRYESGNRRTLVDNRVRIQRDPSYRVTPDEEMEETE